MHTLITFLGKTPRDENGYIPTPYSFADKDREESFFGLALADYLKPDRILVLGTPSSMWDVFVEHLAAEDADEKVRLAIMEECGKQDAHITPELLKQATPLLSRAVGTEVVPCQINKSASADNQKRILEIMASEVKDGQISMDVTHGFRHLGMLGFQSTFVLERLHASQKVILEGIWYGAFEMKPGNGGPAPAIRLDGLQAIQRWTDALNRFDASGDYGVFAPLLEQDGVPQDKAACLQEASFLQTTMNIKAAAQQLRTFMALLKDPLPGASGLFQKRLSRHLQWAKYNNLPQQQLTLAQQSLDRRHYQVASLLGLEALVSLRCEAKGYDPLDFDDRNTLRQELQDLRREQGWEQPLYKTLNSLRNAMAHGLPPHENSKIQYPDKKWRSTQQALKNENTLHGILQDNLKTLKNKLS